MALIVKFVLFIHLFSTDVHPTSRFLSTAGHCSLYNSTIEAYETLIRKANCTQFHLMYVNLTESSRDLFNNITKGILTSLGVETCTVDALYLTQKLIIFTFIGTPGSTTEIFIDGNITYQMEQITLDGLPQLPANIDKLRSVKKFVCYKVHGVDFTIFSEMIQLDYIRLSETYSVTFPSSLDMPSLRWLVIYDTHVIISNESFQFPILDELHLYNNSLQVIPDQISKFTNLKCLSLCSQNFQYVTLDVFANLSQLKVLDLTDNEVLQITSKNQVILPHLQELSLASNKLTSLNVTQWIMPALQFFSIDNNQLYRVDGLLELFTDNMREFIWRVNNSQTFIANSVGGCPSNKWKHPTAKEIADENLKPA